MFSEKKMLRFLSYSHSSCSCLSEPTWQPSCKLPVTAKLSNNRWNDTVHKYFNPWNDEIKQQPVTSETCRSFSVWVLSSLICDLYTCGVWVESVDPVADLYPTNQFLYQNVQSGTVEKPLNSRYSILSWMSLCQHMWRLYPVTDIELIGDANCDLLFKNVRSEALRSFCASLNVHQLIDKPTRVTMTQLFGCRHGRAQYPS